MLVIIKLSHINEKYLKIEQQIYLILWLSIFTTKQNIKMSDRTFKDTFSCFDIPSTEENKNDYQDIEINSKIKQPAINLYEKTLKSLINRAMQLI